MTRALMIRSSVRPVATIGIVSNQAGTCSGYSPAIPPSLGGSTLFVYTPSAAAAFRSQEMLPFFAEQGSTGWNATRFQTNLDSLFGTQLGATLASLVPANQSSLISIGVTTVGSPLIVSALPSSPKASCSTVGVTWMLVALTAMLFCF